MKTYVVIGLGRFGSAAAVRLESLGHEVMAIDTNEENVQRIADQVTHAVVGDARDEAVLRSLGVRNADCAIVAIGADLAASILITLCLKDMGVPQVVCKARDEVHKRALERIGADYVVIPEREMALKLAQKLTSPNLLDFIELSDEYGIAEVEIPPQWVGKTIRELNVRVKYSVDVLGIRRQEKLQLSPGADHCFASGDIAVVLGRNEDLAAIRKSHD
jgi:trk system potassium uptake protein TrkA